MIIFLYLIIISATFMNVCNGAHNPGDVGGPRDEFDVDKLKYEGDPIKFACITSDWYVFQVLDYIVLFTNLLSYKIFSKTYLHNFTGNYSLISLK